MAIWRQVIFRRRSGTGAGSGASLCRELDAVHQLKACLQGRVWPSPFCLTRPEQRSQEPLSLLLELGGGGLALFQAAVFVVICYSNPKTGTGILIHFQKYTRLLEPFMDRDTLPLFTGNAALSAVSFSICTRICLGLCILS